MHFFMLLLFHFLRVSYSHQRCDLKRHDPESKPHYDTQSVSHGVELFLGHNTISLSACWILLYINLGANSVARVGVCPVPSVFISRSYFLLTYICICSTLYSLLRIFVFATLCTIYYVYSYLQHSVLSTTYIRICNTLYYLLRIFVFATPCTIYYVYSYLQHSVLSTTYIRICNTLYYLLRIFIFATLCTIYYVYSYLQHSLLSTTYIHICNTLYYLLRILLRPVGRSMSFI